jgi:hypothetical protein
VGTGSATGFQFGKLSMRVWLTWLTRLDSLRLH